MTTLKQGDLIKSRDGNTRKVLEVCGTILHISAIFNLESFGFTTNEIHLKEEGYTTWDTPTWEASPGIKYWFIDERGDVYGDVWNDDDFDNDRRDFLGIYQTEKLCEASVLEIKSKLK